MEKEKGSLIFGVLSFLGIFLLPLFFLKEIICGIVKFFAELIDAYS